MSTRDQCTTPLASVDWSIPAAGSAHFKWDYDDGRDRLLALHQQGKDKQSGAAKRIDWNVEVYSYSALGAPVADCGTYLCLLVATRA